MAILSSKKKKVMLANKPGMFYKNYFWIFSKDIKARLDNYWCVLKEIQDSFFLFKIVILGVVVAGFVLAFVLVLFGFF